MASKRLLLQTLDSWRQDTAIYKEKRAKEDARRRRQQKQQQLKQKMSR